MKKRGALKADPTAIGNIAKPPFARLPDPQTLFSLRAERFDALAQGHDLAPYIAFLAALSTLQAKIQDGLPEPEMPDAAESARAHEHAMPPLRRDGFEPDASFEMVFERLIAGAGELDMPDPARKALDALVAAPRDIRDSMIANVLADSIPVEAIAQHVFVAAAVQVHFARMAARLDADALKPVGDGACPACGGPPSTTMVVGWQGAHGTRFCACATCATFWNYVRAKCAVCGSTDKISFREIEGASGEIKAEVCESCRSYVKVLYQHKNPALDPIADDVATLGLDLLVKELGFARGGVNPYLIGY